MKPFCLSELIGPVPQSAAFATSSPRSGPAACEQDFHRGPLLLRQAQRRERLAAGVGGAEVRQQPRARLLLDAGRDDAVQHLPPAAEVVVGDPFREPQHLRRDERLAIDEIDDRLEPGRGRLRRPDGDDVAALRLVAAPERHADPLPRPDGLPQLVRNEVGVGRPERLVEHDADREPVLFRGDLPGHRRRGQVVVAEQAGLLRGVEGSRDRGPGTAGRGKALPRRRMPCLVPRLVSCPWPLAPRPWPLHRRHVPSSVAEPRKVTIVHIPRAAGRGR